MDLASVFDRLEKSAAQQIRSEQGDYIIDGLLYCHKCETPKQCRVNVLGRERKPMCLCKCEQEKRDKEDQERKRQAFIERTKKLRKMGFPDEDLVKCNFANDDKGNGKASKVAYQYYTHFEEMLKRGKGLLLFGNVGSGKTFLAASIANELIDKGYPCLVTNFARLTNTISGMYDGKQEYIDGLNKFDLLVIDDLAAERDTEYMNEIVQNIIDARYRSGKPLIITTNLTAKEIYNPTDIKKQRTYSRIAEMCVPLQVEGKDRRKQKAIDDIKDIEKLLDL
jgi:DNA replication protein DnaC